MKLVVYDLNRARVTEMGTAKSRMKKVAPVKEESVCSRGDMHGDYFGPSKKTSLLIRNYTDCNSEFSADDDTLAEVDRILAECENTENRRTYEMPTLGSKSARLCHAKRHASDDMYGGTHVELQHGGKNYKDNAVIKPATNIQERSSPPKNLLGSTNTESPTAPRSFVGAPSLALPVMFDAAEEDLMNTIEREFG